MSKPRSAVSHKRTSMEKVKWLIFRQARGWYGLGAKYCYGKGAQRKSGVLDLTPALSLTSCMNLGNALNLCRSRYSCDRSYKFPFSSKNDGGYMEE